jgi:thermitase
VIRAARAVVLIGLLAIGASLHEPASVTAASAPSFVPGEVLVKFKPQMVVSAHAAVAMHGHAVAATLPNAGWVQVKIGNTQSVAEAVAAYHRDATVESAQPNYVYRARAVPNDPQYGQLWGLRNSGQAISPATYFPSSGTPGDDLDVQPAWDHITDCSSVVVAVLDTGINYEHQDLAANMWDGGAAFPAHGWDFVGNDADPMDEQGHGTHVAGTIGAAGNNGVGVAGVCWRATLMAVRVLDATGSGTTAQIAQGLNFAAQHGAKVVNMSLGGPDFDPLMRDTLAALQSSDVVVFAAAGNDANNIDSTGDYPCGFRLANVVCVTALDQSYALASFANYGALTVDVGAPGTNILSARALQTTTTADSFNSGAVLNWTSSGGWGYERAVLGSRLTDVLADPAGFPSGSYANSANDHVYKTFDLSGAASATLNFTVQFSLQPGDVLNLFYSRSGGDPVTSGVLLDQFTGSSAATALSYDIGACLSAQCSLGFQLLTDGSGVAQGVAIGSFSIATTQLTNVGYINHSGTSMAAPHAAGVAALLRAYNPQYTYADVASAIKNGGRPLGSLRGLTTSGRAVDAMASLAYLNPPSGVRATVTR